MRTLLYYIFTTLIMTGCAPGTDSKTFNPTDPTNISNPAAPTANSHHYYRVSFFGTNIGPSSGLRINGSQQVFLPDEIAVNSSIYPTYIIIYSNNFSCRYDLNQEVYYKNSICADSYSITNQIIYVSNLTSAQAIALDIGFDSN